MRVGIIALLLTVATAVCQDLKPQPMPKPEVPYYDWNACPFEGCVYGEWTARELVTVYDTWKTPREPIGKINKGGKILAETGVVITLRPGIIRIDRDIPDNGMKKNDELLTFSYQGEGFSAIWFKGNYYPSFDISFAKWPDGTGCGGPHCAATYVYLGQREWWVKLKLKDGTVGWVKMPSRGTPFDGTDALADH